MHFTTCGSWQKMMSILAIFWSSKTSRNLAIFDVWTLVQILVKPEASLTSVHISSRFFLEEFRIAKSNFEINWYLLEVYANNQLAAQTFTSLVITIEIMFISMRTNLKKTPAFSKLYSYFLVILDIQIHFYLIKDTFNLLFIKLCYNF